MLAFLGSLKALFVTIALFGALYFGVRFILNREAGGRSISPMIRQIILFSIAVIGVIAAILALPMPDTLRSEISTLMGYVISGVVALSSATFIGNMLAGVLLKTINNFKSGDFIQVDDYFGRVSERGLFHTEIQTVDRNLTTLPNLFLATNPVRVTRSSGTFISTEVSLGYDVSRVKIEKCLMDAALAADLKDPFVLITFLGDFSVVFKIHGLLDDVKRVLTAKSKLNAMVLDKLHEADIEIVSPNFMNQRPVGDTVFIPKRERKKDLAQAQSAEPESLIFDKAEKAEELESTGKELEDLQAKIQALKADLKLLETEDEKAKVQFELDKCLKMESDLKANVEDKQKSIKEVDENIT